MKSLKINLYRNLIAALALIFSGFMGAGCQSTQTPTAALSQVGITPHSAAISQPTLKPLSTAADTISSRPEPTTITLNLWSVEGFGPQSDLVAEQLANFEESNPNVKVKVYLKNSSGRASALNYLRAAKDVAPGVLPDLVILNSDDLPPAWRENLIQPLNGKLDRTIVQDLLPAARKLGEIDNQLAGIPFELDLEHLVYNTSVITAAPILWTDVLSKGASYGFPAKGQKGQLSDASLAHYLAAGAQLRDEEGAPMVDEAALLDMLNFYKASLEEGILTEDILNISQSDELWEQYQSGQIAMTHVSAHRYLTNRRTLDDAQASAIPSPSGVRLAVGRGWLFALVTTDPSRQNHALKLIETFMQTDVNAAWATRSAVIPARQSAFLLVADDDPYWNFLDEILQVTNPPPSFADFNQLTRVLQQAVIQVISGEAAPDEAVQNAVADLEP